MMAQKNNGIKLKNTSCAICGSYSDYDVIYKENYTALDLNKDIFSARRLPDRNHYQIVRCRKDGLIRANPIADTKILKKLYTESCFTYEDEVENLTKTYLYSIQPVLSKLDKKDKILEIGCGNGFLLSALADLGFKNVYGVEPSSDSIRKADNFIEKRIKHSLFRKGLFPDNSFRLICFFQTLDHIPYPNIFLHVCYQLLSKNGYLVAFNHNSSSLSAKLLGERSPIIDIEHPYLYSKHTIRMLFRKNKFHDISISSPSNTLSLRHFLMLSPFPRIVKAKLQNSKNKLLTKSITVKLGNICIIAKKV